MAIRVIVAEFDPIERRRLRALFTREGDLYVVGEAADGREALLAAERFRPDVVLLADILANPGTIEVLKAIRPPPGVVVLGTYHEGALTALAAGADDYVLKDSGTRRAVDAIRRAASLSSAPDIHLGDERDADTAGPAGG